MDNKPNISKSKRLAQQGRAPNKELCLTNFKQYAGKLPVGSMLREIILAQKDKIDATDFVALVPIFLQLSRIEVRQ